MMINIQMNPNNILALPLKLPKFEPDDWDVFWEVWERDKRLYNRNYADTAGNDSLIPGWIGFSWNFNNGYNLGMFDILDKDYSDVFPKFHNHSDFLWITINLLTHIPFNFIYFYKTHN